MARADSAGGAIVPIAVTFSAQVMCAVANLALAAMMPAVAPDAGVSPRLVGLFTAVIYGASVLSSFASANAISGLGTTRVLQACLVVNALGMATLTIGTTWALVIGVTLVGLGAGPLNPASAHLLARRVSSAWYGTVFTVKQTGVPVGFALSAAVVPVLAAAWGWRAAAWCVCGALLAVALVLATLRASLESDAPASTRTGLWQPMRRVFAHRQLRALTLASLLFVVGQHSFTFVLVTYLVERCGLSMVDAGFLLSMSQIGAAVTRLALGPLSDRLRERFVLLAVVGTLICAGSAATGAIRPDWPFWAIAAATLLFGVSAASWNGITVGEVVRWAPREQAGAISSATTAIVFSGAVVGPATFSGLVSWTGDYGAAFAFVCAATLAGGLWMLWEGVRLRRGAAIAQA